MAYRIVYTSEAKLQLTSILQYWCQDRGSINYAKRLIYKLDDLINRLSEFPDLYKVVDLIDLDHKTRMAMIDDYIVLYRVDYESKTVVIGKIVSGKSDYLSI